MVENEAAGRLTATLAPEADGLFRRDRRWQGSDGGYTVALGGSRTIWLLQDSVVSPPGEKRARGVMINNTIGIQHGSDPASAEMSFHWRESDGKPGAFFADDEPGHWLWIGDGALTEQGLVLFFSRVTARAGKAGPWNFRHVGWTARFVTNPEDDPASWDVRSCRMPGLSVFEVGYNGVLLAGGHLYAYTRISERGPVGLVRWRSLDIGRGDLSAMECWTTGGWTPHPAEPAVVLSDAHAFTVHYEQRLSCWLMIDCAGLHRAVLRARTAHALEGPWSDPAEFLTPPERSVPSRFMYQANAHPELTGADLWVTYNCNDESFGRMMRDDSIYYPRFVRVHVR